MKGFYYDTVLDEENICNLFRERALLLKGVLSGKKLIVYGPRNCGKTSLVKSAVIPRFKKKHRKCFVLYADLMEVKDLEAIHRRINLSFERTFSESFPKRQLLETARRFISNLRPSITIDAITAQPTLTITAHAGSAAVPFPDILSSIRRNISPRMPTLIILDEFQDIASVPEAQGLMRNALQDFKGIPIILMGSKKHILSRLFSQPDAPLASFGEDIEFQPIPYEEYHEYISERFEGRLLCISLKDATILQEILHRNPEAINIVCASICESHQGRTITEEDILAAICVVAESRRSRYEELLSHLSAKEEEILISIAKSGPVMHPTSQAFLKTVGATARTVSITINNFMDRSIIERTAEGHRVSDPLLDHFLRRFR